ncbi:MAG: MCE family protein [Bdellovibrionales bacterium]|nr:MCE family protein [Bdellovibrionales bacterium]
MKLTNEAKVGALVVTTLVLAVVFAWVIGIQNPFHKTVDFYVTYHFAGGIEVGSPVRVAGIKVGKVSKIDFFVPAEMDQAEDGISKKEPGSADSRLGKAIPEDENEKVLTPLRLKLSISKEAAQGVRKDSRFYINLAGIIGERYIEVTPGTRKSPMVKSGDTLAGVDPPRIDQLISQSFDLAGKIKEIVDENKGDITKSIELLYKLSGNLNKTLDWVDKSKIFKTDLSKLVENLIAVTSDVKKITGKVNTPEGEKTLRLLYDLLWRLEPLDSKNIREFMQKEGIRVQFF